MQLGWSGTFERLEDYFSTLPRRGVAFTRIYDATRSLVWAAWTDPRHMAQWWGPKDFTNPTCEMDVRPGGALRIIMRAPDGAEHAMSGVFCEIVEPERLVFTMVAEDKNGNPLLEGISTVMFTEHGGKTKLTLRSSAVGVFSVSTLMLKGMEEGWKQSLARLEVLLAIA